MLKLALFCAAEYSSEAPAKPKKGMLSRISVKPSEPKLSESRLAGNTASKEEAAPKAKKGMLSRISAKIVETKPSPPANSSAEANEDSADKPKRNMLSRMSVTGKGPEGKGAAATADEPSVKGGMRGMLNRISAKPGGTDSGPPPAADAMEDISARGGGAFLPGSQASRGS